MKSELDRAMEIEDMKYKAPRPHWPDPGFTPIDPEAVPPKGDLVGHREYNAEDGMRSFTGIHDSGTRQQFEGGAVRDSAADKPLFSLLSPHAWTVVSPKYGRHVRRFLLFPGSSYPLDDLLQALLRDIGIARLCNWLELGAKKYSRFNWAKGMPLSRCIDSLGRHLDKAQRLVEDGEDHLAAAACNVMFLLHYHMEVGAGRLDAKWDDLRDVPWLNKEKA